MPEAVGVSVNNTNGRFHHDSSANVRSEWCEL